MAEKPINPVGMKLNIDGVRDIKKALNQCKKQMEICFTPNSKWDTESCHSYAELSLEGNEQSYIKFLRNRIVCLVVCALNMHLRQQDIW